MSQPFYKYTFLATDDDTGNTCYVDTNTYDPPDDAQRTCFVSSEQPHSSADPPYVKNALGWSCAKIDCESNPSYTTFMAENPNATITCQDNQSYWCPKNVGTEGCCSSS
ncbi:MAG: hypothetical protein CL854_07280 [Cryomorphaceae bacterium]|nr:hypothetical protein [Cryomorphaceae bacterium]